MLLPLERTKRDVARRKILQLNIKEIAAEQTTGKDIEEADLSTSLALLLPLYYSSTWVQREALQSFTSNTWDLL